MRINKHSFFIISLAVSLGLALQPASAASSALAEAEQHFYRARRLLDTDLSGALQALRQAKQALQRSSSESSHRVIQMASREIPKQQMAELFLERSVQPAGRALLHSQIPPLQHKIEGRMEHTRRLVRPPRLGLGPGPPQAESAPVRPPRLGVSTRVCLGRNPGSGVLTRIIHQRRKKALD